MMRESDEMIIIREFSQPIMTAYAVYAFNAINMCRLNAYAHTLTHTHAPIYTITQLLNSKRIGEHNVYHSIYQSTAISFTLWQKDGFAWQFGFNNRSLCMYQQPYRPEISTFFIVKISHTNFICLRRYNIFCSL